MALRSQALLRADEARLRLAAVDRNDPTLLHEQVAVEIRRAIAEGEARPGERIPQAKNLAAVLGVNTNTVLRALRILRDQGLLEVGRGRTIRVRCLCHVRWLARPALDYQFWVARPESPGTGQVPRIHLNGYVRPAGPQPAAMMMIVTDQDSGSSGCLGHAAYPVAFSTTIRTTTRTAPGRSSPGSLASYFQDSRVSTCRPMSGVIDTWPRNST